MNQTINNFRSLRSTEIKNAPIIDWAPLIKTSPLISGVSADKKCHLHCNDFSLAGRSVLCVGGRLKLYPEYGRLIANSGGHLMIFHGDSDDHPENLPQLLEQTDMIICPVDCVNHTVFFVVKYYCKYSGKPCVLLDRSEVNTFNQGIRMLAAMMTK